MFRASFDIIDMSVSVARLTNWDTLAAPVGSVVILHLISQSFRLASTLSTEEVIGVTLDPLPSRSTGLVKITGYVAALRTAGSVSVGDYLFASSTAGVASASSTFATGAFARALSTPDLSSCVKAILLPMSRTVTVLRVRIPSSGPAADFEKSVMMAQLDCELLSVHIVTDSNVTGDATNFAELSIRNKALAAEVCDYIFSAGHDATAFQPLDFGTLDPTNKIFSTNDVLTIKKTHAGGGLTLPAFLLQIRYKLI